MTKVKKWMSKLATKFRTRSGSRVRTEGTEVESNEEVDDPLAQHIPSTVILNDQAYVIPLSENHHGRSPPITLGEGTMAGPSTLQPPLNTTGFPNYGPSALVSAEHLAVHLQRRVPRVPSSSSQREGSSFTESDEDGDECESAHYTTADSASLHSSDANGSVEDVLALGHGHDNADEEVIASPDTYSLTNRDPLGSSLADIENDNDPHTSPAPLLIPELPMGPIFETSYISASPASEQPLRPRQQTWASSGSSYFSLSRSNTEEYAALSRAQTENHSSSSRSQTEDYVSCSQSQTEENSSLSRSQTGGSLSPLSQFTDVKGLPPNRSSSSDVEAGSLSQPLTKSSPDLINNVLPDELIVQILSLCLRLPIGCFDGAVWRRIVRTRYQLRLVCHKWDDLISMDLLVSSVLPSSLSPCVLPPSEKLSWYKEQITRKSVVDNLSLPLRQYCPDTGCRYREPYHVDLTFLRILSSAIPKCRALKVFLPHGFVVDWLQADNDNMTTEVTIPMSFPTPNLRCLSWTFNFPLSATIPHEFEFPWVALRHVTHGLKWSLLTTVELDCPLTIEDCLFILSEGQENLERASFRTVDGLGGEWTSAITLLKLDSLSVEGIGHLGLLFAFLKMECHRRLGITSHTREGDPCEPTPSLHTLDVRWRSLTHVDLYCHLTRSALVRLMCGLCKVVSFQWRGHLTPDADAGAPDADAGAPDADAGASLPEATTAVHTLDHLTEAIVHSNQAGCEAILDILTESHGALFRKIIIDKPVIYFFTPLIPVPGEWDLRNHRKLNKMKAALHSITLNDVEHPISISDAWAILSQCRQLKELDVRVTGSVESSGPLAGDELSSNLQILKLDLDVSAFILFRNLSLPKLATLEMSFPDSNHIYAKRLDAALKRWGCPLTCLLLRNSNLGEGTLIKCLTSVSSTLKDLLIYGVGPRSGCTVGKLALQQLTPQEGLDHNLCPKLESLTLEPCVAPDGALAQLLSSKAPPLLCIEKIVPLRRVRVSFLKAVVPSMREVRKEDLKVIRGLKATGMDIELVD